MDPEQKRAREVLSDVLECDEGLSHKDISFVESMDEKRNYPWTEAQIKWLDDIYERVC